MNNRFLSSHLDFLGFGASFLCAIHCALLPLVLTVGMMGGLSWLANPVVENGFIATSLGLAAISLYPSFKKKHQRSKALKIAGLGFGLLFFSRLVGHGDVLEVITVVVGGLLIAYAHYVNWKLLKTLSSCSSPSIERSALKKAS